MRKYDENDIDEEEKIEDWMFECLKVNPEYVYWGNYEDYMWKDSKGWDSSLEYDSIEDGLFGLDDLNECVHFYFEAKRESKTCSYCEGTGYNKGTKQLYDDWYDFKETGRRWCDNITQDEVEALVKNGRLTEFTKEFYGYSEEEGWYQIKMGGEHIPCEKPKIPKAEEVNKNKYIHDCINHWICVKARAKRLGIFGYCEDCSGKGYVYIEPKARLRFQLWMLHPRKGCSRGVYIKNIERKDLPKIYNFLQTANLRNMERFSKINKLKDL